MEYTLNTKHFVEEIVACLDKATIKSLCEKHGIPCHTAADRKYMAKKLAWKISKAKLILEFTEESENG